MADRGSNPVRHQTFKALLTGKDLNQYRMYWQLDVPTGTIYPALRRLERAGYLRSEWRAVGARKRRTYRLTAVGGRT